MGRVVITPDRDFASLSVEVESGAFRGDASATLYVANEPDFEIFLNDLGRYPLDRCSLTLGGYGRVRLAAYQCDPHGHLRLEVEVAKDETPDSDLARVSIRTDYPRLLRFREQLRLMRIGELDRIEITD